MRGEAALDAWRGAWSDVGVQRRALLVSIVVLVALGALLLRCDGRSVVPAEMPSGGASSASAELSGAPALESEIVGPSQLASDDSLSRTAVAAATAGVLEVTVHGPSGPVVDAPVTVTLTRPPKTVRATTDERGRARFEFEGRVRLEAAKSLATASTASGWAAIDRWLAPGTLLTCDVVLDQGHVLTGRVVGRGGPFDGRGVPDAVVELWSGAKIDGVPAAVAITDDAGRFVFGRAPEEFVALARAEGHVSCVGVRGSIFGATPMGAIELVVAPIGSLRGRVCDEFGAPIVGARVVERGGCESGAFFWATRSPNIKMFDAGHGVATTDADGLFEIAGLPAAFFSVFVEAEGFQWGNWSFDPAWTPVEFRLPRANWLTGRVLDASGEPAVGARVAWGDVFNDQFATTTDGEGRFRVSTVLDIDRRSSDSTRLVIVHTGHAVAVVDPVPRSATSDAFVEVQLEREWTMRGVVVDELRRGVAGARVSIESATAPLGRASNSGGATWWHVPSVGRTRTDSAGVFWFENLSAGEFTLHASPPNDHRFVSVSARAGDQAVEVVLASAELDKVLIEGHATAVETGEPLQDFCVSATVDGVPFDHECKGRDGHFEFAGLPVGDIALHFEDSGSANLDLPPQHFELGRHTVDVELFPWSHLEVRVEGDLAAGTVEVQDAAGVPLWIDGAGRRSTTRVALTDGQVEIELLPATRVTVVVDAGVWLERVALDLVAYEDNVLVLTSRRDVDPADFGEFTTVVTLP